MLNMYTNNYLKEMSGGGDNIIDPNVEIVSEKELTTFTPNYGFVFRFENFDFYNSNQNL